ncbi:MAG TPA: rRNA maturation RNase YbeY [Ktedonobacteraceae bacterium]|jgi:probable rRNA maturation factor|nr:rRNA maturation RNase YbeY [Ktedonobacteraceae bacterium]
MQEHPLIELYVSLSDEQQNTTVETLLEKVNLDDVALRTLHVVGITEPVMLTLLVTDDASIQELNQQYREQNKPTDVLSFPLLDKPLVNAPAELLWEPRESEYPEPDFVTPPGMVMNLGDIVMAWPTVARQATEAGHSPLAELLYLLAHGVLHLVGYDDHSQAGYEEMVRIQRAVLLSYGQKA